MSMYQPYEGEGWAVGHDFDPSDQDEMEVMRLVFEKERYDRIRELERENNLLRALLEPNPEEDE